MYDDLRSFGRFVSQRGCQAFLTATKTWLDERKHDDPERSKGELPPWMLALIRALESEEHKEAMAGRRALHHFFKTVDGFDRQGLLTDHDLVALTSAQSGWKLWHMEALPVTRALGIKQRTPPDARPFSDPVSWAERLIEKVRCLDPDEDGVLGDARRLAWYQVLPYSRAAARETAAALSA